MNSKFDLSTPEGLVLALVCSGKAKIEVSATRFAELNYRGVRFFINGDWGSLVQSIGKDEILTSLQEVGTVC